MTLMERLLEDPGLYERELAARDERGFIRRVLERLGLIGQFDTTE